MKNIFKLFILSISVATLFGCATASMQMTGLLDRAAFDLDCKKENLTTQVLSEDKSSIPAVIESVGVSGCGKKATYVQTRNGWVLNSNK